MLGASLALFADLGACHVQESSVTICFLPAPSGWRATDMVALGLFGCIISIHALRVEGDPVLLTSILCYCGVIISSVFSKKLDFWRNTRYTIFVRISSGCHPLRGRGIDCAVLLTISAQTSKSLGMRISYRGFCFTLRRLPEDLRGE